LEQNKLKSGMAYALVLLLGISGAFSYYLYDQYINTDYFLPGVEIGGIPVQGYNLEEAATAISQAIFAMNAASVTFYKDDYIYQTKLGDLCSPIDPGKIAESAWKEEKARSWRAKVANINGKQKVKYPVNLPYNSAVKTKLLQEWTAKWGAPSQNASLEVNSKTGLVIIPAQYGMMVNVEATYKALPTNIDEASSFRIPIIVERQKPQVTDDMLKDMGELSSFSTYFNSGEVNRSHNLYMAASSINKSIIAPHTVFSFNNTVGQRTMEKGYLDAMVIVGGKFEPGLGGGICQVSSTLYNACLLAGLEIKERSNHGLAVAYVPLGRDATVAYGIQDFKFKNNTDYPIYIRALTSGGKLTVNIYGNLNYKKKISIYHIVDETVNYTTVTERDPKLQPGEQKIDHNGQPGYVVRSFRTFYGNDGKAIKTEQLARDVYKPLNKLILEGPEALPAPVPNTGTNPPPDGNGSQQPGSNVPVQPIVPIPPNNTNQETPGAVNPNDLII